MEKNKTNIDSIILPLLLIGYFYYKYREYIDEKINDPYFLIFVGCLGIFIYLIYLVAGHYIERTINKITMWRQGIKADPKEEAISFPFTSFDLQEELDSFYSDKSNLERTFVGLDASKSNKEVVSIPDIQRSQHLQVLGMTGTGKTAGIFLPLIYQDALKNRPVIILDAKGELTSIDQLNAMLGKIGGVVIYCCSPWYTKNNPAPITRFMWGSAIRRSLLIRSLIISKMTIRSIGKQRRRFSPIHFTFYILWKSRLRRWMFIRI